MRRLALLSALLILAFNLHACSGPVRSADPMPPASARTLAAPAGYPEDHLHAAELEAHLRFLASDEMMGRKTGTPGNNVAARYIAEQFRAAGLQPVPGADGYFQPIPFAHTAPPARGHLNALGDAFIQGKRLLLLAGEAPFEAEAPAVFAGFGSSEQDYASLDAAGKIVFTQAGRPDDPGVQAAFRATPEKRRLAAAHGAVALVELYDSPFPWASLVGALATPRFGIDEADGDGPGLPLAWLDDTGGALLERIRTATTEKATLASPGMNHRPVPSNNVVGMVEGSDPDLRDEFVVLMAHYDHLGAGLRNGPAATPADSIFNGARDNAMGTVAVLAAARALGRQPPRRSVLLLALTAEENGLLGSRYYIEHPLLPLDRVVFALNIDGGGYSDTTIVTVIGLGRTTADDLLRQGAAAYGLGVIGDPAPEQNLFDRSDNVNFARQGIPAPTFSPGFRSFSDPGIARYYHRPQDEAGDDFDYAYLKRFAQAYTHAARLIADSPARIAWVPGDKYEEAARALYSGE